MTKTTTYIKHVYGLAGEEEKVKRTLEADPEVLIASFVQYSTGTYSFLVSRIVTPEEE